MSAASLDPRARLVLYGAATVAAIATLRPVMLLGIFAVALAMIVLLRGVRRWLGMLRLLLPMLALLALLSLIGGVPGDAVLPVLKLLTLGTLSTAYFGATTVDELGDTFALLRLPPGVAFVLTGGLRYAPALAASWASLMDAQRARGARIPTGPRALPEYARLLLPAVVRALRTADAMAEAMESRGFGTHRPTLLATYRLRAWDWLVIVFSAAGPVAALVWGR